MNKEQIIATVQKHTTANTLDEAVSVYYGLFDSIDTSLHTADDVLSDIREARQRGDTACEVTGQAWVTHDLPAYRFEAYNTAAQYGFGTGDDAAKYCAHLNRGRETTYWQAEEITDPAELADLEGRDDVFMIEDSLAALAADSE